MHRNPIISFRTGDSPHIVAQTLTAVSQVFNQINTHSIHWAVSSECFRLDRWLV